MKTSPSSLSPAERVKFVDFLDSHPVGVLASVDESGNPYASTIYFSVDDELNITFTTKRDTHKHKNISRHNTVMLVVYDTESQSAAQISGAAAEETDPDTVQKIYHGTLQAAKQTGEDSVPPIAKISAGPYVAYVLKPEDVWMVEYGWGDSYSNALSQAGKPAATDDPD